MMKKWYIGTLLTALALLVIVQEQTVVPNQEIVLEFADTEVTAVEAQDAIAIVKNQLESIGVRYTKISKELRNGKLTIAYYSDEDVESIKKILSEEGNVELNHVLYAQNQGDNQIPVNKDSKDYSFDVCKIQKSTDFDTDFNDIYIIEIDQKQGGNSSDNSFVFVTRVAFHSINELIKVTQKINTNIAIAIDRISRNIPEVRAGPIS